MKKKDILISLAIIVACLGLFLIYSFTNSLVHGYIEIDSGGASAKLMLHGSLFTQDFEISENEPVLINTRVTKPMSLTISKTQDSNSLQLVSYGPWGDLSRIKIKNNETLSLKVGPPLIIKPTISNYKGTVRMGFSVVGQAGEQYQIPRTKTNPKVKIMDENGNIIASGNFAYG
ncbi:MAG: hypothetical protein JXA96_07080 [Sedimentisphaerales bacterium]|nr:hypothetical protein [Sedimentisphaerales bacterium]